MTVEPQKRRAKGTVNTTHKDNLSAKNGQRKTVTTKSPFFPCPHCGQAMQTRTSRMLSLMMREIYFQCVNVPDCGFTSKGYLEQAATLSPSQNPNPLVYLPVGKTKVLPQDPRQMDLLAEITPLPNST